MLGPVFGTMKLLSILCKVAEFQKEESALEPRDSGIRTELFSWKGPTAVKKLCSHILTGDVDVSPQDKFRYVSPHSVQWTVEWRVLLWHNFEKRVYFWKPWTTHIHITQKSWNSETLFFFWDFPLSWSRQLLVHDMYISFWVTAIYCLNTFVVLYLWLCV